MKTLSILATVCLASCTPQAYPVDTPNPLDEPGYTQPTAAELHAENVRIIQGIAR